MAALGRGWVGGEAGSMAYDTNAFAKRTRLSPGFVRVLFAC